MMLVRLEPAASLSGVMHSTTVLPPNAFNSQVSTGTNTCADYALIWYTHIPCTDPEIFVRGGPILLGFFLVDKGREDQNTTIRGPSSAR